MAKQITEYKIFLASPGDTANERAVVEKIISEIDRTLGDHHRFRLKLLKWETDTYPDFGEDGQDVINRQIGMDYDIFIGIMWKRFGTKTNRAESGTQEEFQRAHKEFEEKGFPKIMFYFNSAPLPQDSDMSQFELVKNFKATLGEQGGYYFTYNSEQQFVDLLRPHLTKMLLNMKPAKTILEQEAEAPIGTHKIDKPASMQQSAVVPEINTEFEEYLNDMEAISFESDSAQLIKAINDRNHLPELYGIVSDILGLIGKGCSFKIFAVEKNL